jgi:hypothetical protein
MARSVLSKVPNVFHRRRFQTGITYANIRRCPINQKKKRVGDGWRKRLSIMKPHSRLFNTMPLPPHICNYIEEILTSPCKFKASKSGNCIRGIYFNS